MRAGAIARIRLDSWRNITGGECHAGQRVVFCDPWKAELQSTDLISRISLQTRSLSAQSTALLVRAPNWPAFEVTSSGHHILLPAMPAWEKSSALVALWKAWPWATCVQLWSAREPRHGPRDDQEPASWLGPARPALRAWPLFRSLRARTSPSSVISVAVVGLGLVGNLAAQFSPWPAAR